MINQEAGDSDPRDPHWCWKCAEEVTSFQSVLQMHFLLRNRRGKQPAQQLPYVGCFFVLENLRVSTLPNDTRIARGQ
jgi:hypothetical protein